MQNSHSQCFLLVYRTFLETYDDVPTLIVGVLDMDKTSSDYDTQVLRLEGHKLAESKKEYCKFLPAGPAIQAQRKSNVMKQNQGPISLTVCFSNQC